MAYDLLSILSRKLSELRGKPPAALASTTMAPAAAPAAFAPRSRSTAPTAPAETYGLPQQDAAPAVFHGGAPSSPEETYDLPAAGTIDSLPGSAYQLPEGRRPTPAFRLPYSVVAGRGATPPLQLAGLPDGFTLGQPAKETVGPATPAAAAVGIGGPQPSQDLLNRLKAQQQQRNEEFLRRMQLQRQGTPQSGTGYGAVA